MKWGVGREGGSSNLINSSAILRSRYGETIGCARAGTRENTGERKIEGEPEEDGEPSYPRSGPDPVWERSAAGTV